MAFAMWEFISVFVFSLLLAYPLGAYLADVMQAKPMKSDAFLNGLSNRFMLFSVSSSGMNWRQYLGAFVLSNILLLGQVSLF
jgi:K+-transporting ATPase ATPase A chain